MPRLEQQSTDGTEPVTAAIARAVTVLTAAGVASPRVDAELIAAYVLDVPRSRLMLAAGLSRGHQARFDDLIGRRAQRVPLQHLTGQAPFRYLELAVGPGVFTPRPETELLVDWGLAAGRSAGRAPLVLDLCAGSGAIALAMANELPNAQVYAVERGESALPWLRRNAADRAAAGDTPVTVVAADVTDPDLLPTLAGQVDVLLCNPPYVPDAAPVSQEVAQHDPAEAVFGGPDGLSLIRPLLGTAARLLRPGGALGIEHDDSHDRAVPDLLRADDRYTEVELHRDLAGRPRFTTARRAHGRLSS